MKQKLKALYMRANGTIKSKTGSSLLMVVMVMSICIILGTSFVMMSSATFVNSSKNKTHTKATATAMSVAETVKTGLSTLMESNYYVLMQMGGDNTLYLDVDGNFAGDVTVKIEVVDMLGGTPTMVLITITVVLNGYTETLSFTASTNRNSINDIVNSVSNATAATGGGSFSFRGKQLSGDVSLNGDYLIAPKFSLSNELCKTQGEITGNLYVNGSAILGIDTDALYIGGNVYVNGDLTINACHIGKLNSSGALVSGGNVYVAGNIIMNGLTSDVATIWGNVYCGGDLIVQNNEISAFATGEIISGGNVEAYTLISPSSAFNYTYGKYDNEAAADAALYNLTLSNNPIYNGLAGDKTVTNITANTSNKTVTIHFHDGTTTTVQKDLMNIWGSSYFYDGQRSGMYYFDNGDYNRNEYLRYIATGSDGAKVLVLTSKWWKAGSKGDVKRSDNSDSYWARSYDVVNCEIGSWYYENSTYTMNPYNLINSVIRPYESTLLTGNIVTAAQAALINLPTVSRKSLTIHGNVFVQGDAILQTSANLIGKSGTKFEVAGDLIYSCITDYTGQSGTVNIASGVGQTSIAATIKVGNSWVVKDNKITALVPTNVSGTTKTEYTLGTEAFYSINYVSHYYTKQGTLNYRWNYGWETAAIYQSYNNAKNVAKNEASGENWVNYVQGSKKRTDAVIDSYKWTDYVRLSTVTNYGIAYLNSFTAGANISSEETKSGAIGTASVYSAWLSTAAPSQVTPMYTQDTIDLNSNYIEETEKKKNPVYVADVFKEMGVWQLNVNTTTYKDGAHGVFDDNTKTVINKKNDSFGVNFTGVYVAQIAFASTLAQSEALNERFSFYGTDGRKYYVKVPEGQQSYSVLNTKADLIGVKNRDIGSTDTLWMAPNEAGQLLNVNYLFVWACQAYTASYTDRFGRSGTFRNFIDDLPTKYWTNGTKTNYNPANSSYTDLQGSYVSQMYAYYYRYASLYFASGSSFIDPDKPNQTWSVRSSSTLQVNHAAYMQNFYAPYANRTLLADLNYWGNTSNNTDKQKTMSVLMEWASYALRDMWKMEYDKIQAGTLTYQDAFWLKYVGVQACYNASNPVDWNYFIMRDIYIDGTETGLATGSENGSNLHFGLSAGSKYKESIWLDATYGDIRLYMRPTGYVYSVRGNDSSNGGGYVDNGILFDYSTMETVNWDTSANRADHIGYVYIIPNYYKGSNPSACLANTTRMTGTQLKAEYLNMLNGKAEGVGTGRVYLGNDSNTYYRYESAVTFSNSYNIANDRTSKLLFESSRDDIDNGVMNNAGSFIFVICEGPIHVRMGNRQDFQGILYAPHERAVFELRNGTARGTPNGGAIVVGSIWTNTKGDNNSSIDNLVFNSIASTDPDFAWKLAQGLNVATIEGGSDTNVDWSFSGYS